MTSPADVARWMLAEFESQDGWLDQEDAVLEIEQKFGAAFVQENDNGGLSIKRCVLAAFRELTADTVVWIPSERAWRRRDRDDPRGKRSAE